MEKIIKPKFEIMKIQTAKRLQGIGEYYFSTKLREIEELNKHSDTKIINLGIGSPDLPPDKSVIKILQEKAELSTTHAYQPYKGILPFKEAIANWYNLNYNVTLNPVNEILPLIGSKEGIMHICMTYLNNGDKVLVPNPGYPTYSSAVQLSGGVPIYYDLKAENNWEPNFLEIEKNDLSGVKMIWVNYPNMPTGKNASFNLFQKIVDFGLKYNILICHDNPYSFILNENPMSLLSIPDSKEIAIELNSLSKSHNMAGWRVGMICAAEERINEIISFKSNMDSGMFMPIQLAAIQALSLNKEWNNSLNKIYQKRKEIAFQILETLNCTFDKDQVGLFVWAKIPSNFKDGYDLSDHILYNKKIFITPGGIFGTNGNNYLRISLCSPEAKLFEALTILKK